MDGKLIDLAARLVAEATLNEWLTAILILSVWFVGSLLLARGTGYSKRLGEIEAETKQLGDIKKSLEETTRVTKAIEAEFSEKAWRQRERMTVMRKKLEQVVAAAYLVRQLAAKLQLEHEELDRYGDLATSADRLGMIAALYFAVDFADLYLASLVIQQKANALAGAVIQITGPASRYNFAVERLRVDPAATPVDVARKAWEDASAKCGPVANTAYAELLAAVTAFEKQALKVMKEFLS